MATQKNMHYTYEDYCTWHDGNRWELIEGIPHMMSPAPSKKHQEISMELSRQLANYLRGKSCRVFAAPFDVRLAADGKDDTVCQPDVLVVCDEAKLNEKGCKGAPDLIVEIVSPSSDRHDRVTKLALYQRAGVREYWMVSPDTGIVQVCILQDGQYYIHGYKDTDTVTVHVLKDCVVELREVFGVTEEES